MRSHNKLRATMSWSGRMSPEIPGAATRRGAGGCSGIVGGMRPAALGCFLLCLAPVGLPFADVPPEAPPDTRPGAPVGAPKGAAETRPNFIIIYADDLGWMDTGFQGSRYYETPNLDRLARA